MQKYVFRAYADREDPQTESFDTIECSLESKMSGWDFAHLQDDVNLYIFHMFEGTFFG